MVKKFAVVGNEAVGDFVSRALEEAGWARTPDISDAEVVFTYCTHASALEDAYFDEDGLVKRAVPDTLLVDLSPSTPSLAREVGAVAAVNDLRFVEAPLVVSDPVAGESLVPNNVVCLVAGDDEKAIRDASAALALICATVDECGASGSAQLAKAACTSQIASQILSAVESFALYRVSQTAPGAEAFGLTSVTSKVLEAIGDDRFKGDYTVEMLMGEVVAAMTVADDADLILPQLEAIMHLLEVLAVIGGADMSPAALSLIYRDEETCAKHGLDWTRAENLFVDEAHAHHHDHDHMEFGDAADYGDGIDDFYGFGGYSAN